MMTDVLVPQPRASAEMRLVCFPFAGGGPSVFRPWAQSSPPWIELGLVALPGREARLLERPFERVAEVVDTILPALVRTRDRRLALFGHSLGGLQAFETARRLEALGIPLAVLIVSGVEAPRVRKPLELSTKSDPDLVAALRELGGTPAEVLDNPELMSLMLPAIRADFAMAEAYEYVEPPEPPLRCRIVALAGDRDEHADVNAMAKWEGETTGAFRLHVLEGDHFFVLSQRERVLRIVLEALLRS